MEISSFLFELLALLLWCVIAIRRFRVLPYVPLLDHFGADSGSGQGQLILRLPACISVISAALDHLHPDLDVCPTPG